jgi:uncharacterized sulfatase
LKLCRQRPETHARGVGSLLACLMLVAAGAPAAAAQPAAPAARPNILWLSSEDNGPHLGAYGDDFADTPNLDELATRGLRYDVVWSNAPVCAPARTTIITGVHATSLGAQHMRSSVRLPPGFELFPFYLRQAGYYTSNNAKEDYNLEGWGIADEGSAARGRVWDESSREAHWRKRPDGAPFFSVFNYGVTHESQIRRRPHTPVHDPAGVRLPAYHPDTPEVRGDWAQYYDKMTVMDAQVGERLRELERDGLADDTIVFYWGDHGIGLPRGKRTPLDSGLRVPLIVYVPPAYRHLASDEYEPGGGTDRPVAFVDFAATMLSVAGIEPPAHFQGRAFLGSFQKSPKRYLFGYRGRMDERYDLARSVRDGRWVYVRNYHPHRGWGQFVYYMFETPTTQVWNRMWLDGELTPEQSVFWSPSRPFEELYDLEADPDEVHNLASSREHRRELERLREVLDAHLAGSVDLGFMPEAEMLERSRADSPWQAGRDPSRYDFEQVHAAAKRAAADESGAVGELRRLLESDDALLRYWGATGLLIRRAEAVEGAESDLVQALGDPSPSVRIVAAEALVRWGTEVHRRRSLEVLLALADLEDVPVSVAMFALNALDATGERAAGVLPRLKVLPTDHEKVSRKLAGNVPRLLERILDQGSRESSPTSPSAP